MNKRQFALTVALIVMLVCIWVAARSGYRMLVSGRLTEQVNTALTTVGNGYDQRMLALGELTFSHASWDDMYEFVQRGRGEAANRLFANAAKIASYVLVFNDRGIPVFARAVGGDASADVLEALVHRVKTSRILSHQSPDSVYAAPLLLSRRLLLTVSRPILPTSRKGAVRGSVVVAADWDPARDAGRSSAPPVAVDVFDVRAPETPADVRAMVVALRTARRGVGDIGDGRTGGYLLLDDIDGSPAIVLRAAFSGGWTPETERHFLYFAGLLGAIGCVFLLIFLAIGRGPTAPAAPAAVPSRRRGPEDEGETFYRTIAAKTRDGLFSVDAETRVISVNSHGADYFNTSPDRVINKFIKDLVPPDAEKVWRTNIADAYRLGIATQFQYQAKVKGERVPMSVWLVPFKDKSGTVYKVVGVSRPAHPPVQPAPVSPPAEPPPPSPPSPHDLFRLFDTADQAMVVVDSRTLSVVYLNAAAAALWGLAAVDAVGKPLENILPAEVASAWKQQVASAADSRRTVYTEEYLQAADGRICAGVWMIPLAASTAGGSLVAAFLHDITSLRTESDGVVQAREELAAVKAELVRAQEAISAERHRFLAAFDQINEVIFALDVETMSLVYVNRFTAIQWNNDLNELIGKKMEHVLPPERASVWLQHARTAVDTGSTIYVEENVGAGTTGLMAGCWVVPVRTAAGMWDTVLVISHDISDIRKSVIELQRKEEEITRLRKELSALPAPSCAVPPDGGAPAVSPALAVERLASVFDDAGLSVFVVEASTGRFCYLNAHAAVRWKVSVPEAVGKTAQELLSAEAASRLHENIGTLLATGSVRSYDDADAGADGTRWTRTWLVPVCNHTGAVEKILGISHEVAELRGGETARDKGAELDRILKEPVPENLVAAEQEMTLEQQRLLSVFDSIDEIIYVVDPQTYELLYVNPTFRKVFGEDFVGRKCFEVFQGTGSPCSVCSSGVGTAAQGGGATHAWECRNNLNQGWYHCLDGTMTWSDGRTVCYKIAFDITERRFLEEKLFQVHKQLQITFEQTVNALAETMKSRNVYTARHQQRVASLACAIARDMGFHSHVVDGIRMASLIHDIGYVSIPAEILDKRGQLTTREISILKMHPQVGYNIIKTIPFPWPVAQMVLQHHERLDGTGYPLGLTAEDIIVEARILAVADVVEAMANYRPYRPARGLDSALDEIAKHRGDYYDPDVVDVCLALFKEKAFKF